MSLGQDNKIFWYFRNIGVAVDQFFNALFFGDPDETLSSRMGKSQCRVCRLLCRILHVLEPKHCEKSIEADEGARGVF